MNSARSDDVHRGRGTVLGLFDAFFGEQIAPTLAVLGQIDAIEDFRSAAGKSGYSFEPIALDTGKRSAPAASDTALGGSSISGTSGVHKFKMAGAEGEASLRRPIDSNLPTATRCRPSRLSS